MDAGPPEAGVGPASARARVTSRRRHRLIGRADALDRVRSHLRDVAAGSGAVRGLLVEGEAGVGKTRLVEDALSAAAGQLAPGRTPATVLRGGGDPFQVDRPFGAVLAALGVLEPDAGPAEHALWTTVTGAPDTASVGPGGRSQLSDAVVATFRERARRTPVYVVLDDLHWVDAASLGVVAELCDVVPGADLVVVATARPTPRTPEFDRLVATIVPGRAATMTLDALDGPAVLELVSAELGGPPTAALAAHVDRAGGNPLFVTELLDALAEEGALVRTDDGSVDLAHASLPPSLRVTLLRRLSALPGPALEALRLASLLGATFALDHLAAALGTPAPGILTRLREPLDAGWIEPRGDHLAFRHELVRDALHADTPVAIRRGLHRHIATQLRAVGADDTVVARHLLLGAIAPDPAAATWLAEAGQRIATRDPVLATEVFGGAAALGPPAELRDTVTLRLAVAQLWSNATEEGAATLRELLARPHDPAVDAQAGLALSRSLLLHGRSAEAIEVLERTAGRATSPRDRAPADAERALAHLLRGELPMAAAAVALVDAARDDAPDESRCLARAITGSIAGLAARTDVALAETSAAVAVATASDDPETSRRPPQLFFGSMLLDCDRFAEGFEQLDLARRISERLGALWDVPLHHLLIARGRLFAGDLDDAVAEAETSLVLAAEHGTHLLEAWAHALIAHAQLRRSDVDAVRSAVEAGERAAATYGVQVRGTDWLVWARAALAELDGDTEVARTLVAAVWDAHAERGIVSERRRFGPELVRLHLAVGDRGAAREVAAATADAADRSGLPTFRAAAARARGLADDDVDLLAAAVALTRSTGCRPEHVACALDAADASARAGHREQAVALYEEAHTVADACGATRDVRRADGGLRELGVRRGVRGPRSRDRTGWGALTPTERTVTELAAQGLSNPEIGDRLFISRRTVQTHLSHVFAKLGVATRVELAAEAARRPPTS